MTQLWFLLPSLLHWEGNVVYYETLIPEMKAINLRFSLKTATSFSFSKQEIWHNILFKEKLSWPALNCVQRGNRLWATLVFPDSKVVHSCPEWGGSGNRVFMLIVQLLLNFYTNLFHTKGWPKFNDTCILKVLYSLEGSCKLVLDGMALITWKNAKYFAKCKKERIKNFLGKFPCSWFDE